jgi:hypothetical protein
MNAPGATQEVSPVDILEQIPVTISTRARAAGGRSFVVLGAAAFAASCVLGGAVLAAKPRLPWEGTVALHVPGLHLQETSPHVATAPGDDVPLVSVEDLPRAGQRGGRCVLRTPTSPPDRRVFVDGRVMGTTSAPVDAPCGSHVVQVGSAGTPRRIELPCGGDIDVR